MPVRVGFTPTFSRRKSLPGTMVAATMRKAALEMSPASSVSSGARGVRCGKATAPWAPPPRGLTCAPMAASIRSVWSREGPGSVKAHGPSAESAARMRQLFTWAEATGSA